MKFLFDCFGFSKTRNRRNQSVKCVHEPFQHLNTCTSTHQPPILHVHIWPFALSSLDTTHTHTRTIHTRISGEAVILQTRILSTIFSSPRFSVESRYPVDCADFLTNTTYYKVTRYRQPLSKNIFWYGRKFLRENSWKNTLKNARKRDRSIAVTFMVQTHRNQKLSPKTVFGVNDALWY